jgi:phenylalanyl-tRNA synthetase beta chain
MTLPSREPGAKIPLVALTAGGNDRLTVTTEDADLCPRYAAAVADLVPAQSPDWMTRRLEAAGVRPISAIVDITNYVLLELGQPTHAFDLAKLAGPEIRVRRAKRGEPIRTLDDVARTLEPDMLVIADRDRAQAVAGVMGGVDSEISGSTTTAVFESAYFKPASVRRTSKRLGLKTEASSRFERGGDINGAVTALERIAALMAAIGAGRISGAVIDVYPQQREPARLHMRRKRMSALLGVIVPDTDVERILRHLGLTVTAAGDGWDVVAPTVRVDLLREADLIEEVGRHYGFDKLEATYPVATAPAPPPDPRVPRDRLVRHALTAAGLSEAVTFGFIEAKAAAVFAATGSPPPIAVANPLSAKFDTLRTSLMPGIVDAVAHNRRHGRADVALFEIGTRFSIAGETRGVGIAWTGLAAPTHWSGTARPVDFFDVSGAVEGLCRALDTSIRLEPATEPFLVDGQTAGVLAPNGTNLGIVGRLAPAAADARGLPKQDPVFVAELNLDAIAAQRLATTDATYPLPRHPAVVRDLSIVVDDVLPAAIIRGTIQAAGRSGAAPLSDVMFFDRYQGKGVPDGRVSVSVRLTFQAADRTLTDAEVQQSVEAILAALVREHGAVQR